ncbi:MAG: ABC transporter ATP-binding protein [Candidatus Nezhaarchaeales archaeon]
MALLEVKNLYAGYSEATVLFDISLSVNKGETIAIIGRNGAGKTTLLRTIAGFINPKAGKIIFNGEDVTNLSPYVRGAKGIRYVNQEKRVFSDLTTRDNLEMAMIAAGVPKSERGELLKKVVEYFPKLSQLMDKKAGYLSGGERQMLLISRALVSNPKIILLDEPTEGLAPKVVRDLSDVLLSVKKDTTIVLVEQNASLVGAIADRIYVMNEGKITHTIEDKNEIRSLSFINFLEVSRK